MGDGQLFITGFANATSFTATICTAVHDAVAIGLEGPYVTAYNLGENERGDSFILGFFFLVQSHQTVFL
jgi:hypothetical protein